MASCPLYTTPEWQALESALGFADALTAHSILGETPATVDQARKLLKQHAVMDADEREVRNSESFKLKRVQAQTQTLESYKTLPRTTPSQIKALDKLIANQHKYQQILEDNVGRFDRGELIQRTTSVTSFIGSSDYTGAQNYEEFKKFGTYMHLLLEDLQQLGNKQNRSAMEVLTREIFDQHRAGMRKDTTFSITGLDENTLYQMAQQMTALLQKDSKSRALILPEITLLGMDKYNQPVVGRLDLMIMDTDGNIKIFDFKTKKVDGLVDSTGAVDPDAARTKLASAIYTMDQTTGTAQNFQMGSRTTYDTWTLQTKTYENMLRQAGLSVSGSEIISLLYQASKTQVFEGYAVEVFSGNNYYTGAGKGAKTVFGKLLTEDATTRTLNDYRKKVDEMLPISPEQQLESEELLQREFAFDVSPAQNEAMLKALTERVDAEMGKTNANLRLHKKDSAIYNLHKARLQTLKGFKDTINRSGTLGGTSLKMAFTLEALETEFKQLETLSQNALKGYHDLSGKSQTEALEILRLSYGKVLEMRPIYDLISGVVRNAVADENVPQVNQDSHIKRRIDALNDIIEQVTESFRTTALENFVHVIQQQIGEDTYQVVGEAMRQKLEPEIQELERQLELLKNNLPLNLKTRIGNGLFNMINKISRDFLTKDLDDAARSNLSQIEAIEHKLTQLRIAHKTGFSYKTEDIRAYVEGISDPKNNFFVGQSDAFSKGFSFRLDGFMAGMANSDQALYAMVSLLKQAEADAISNAQASFQVTNFDKYLRPLVQELGEQGANEAVTETRSYTRQNRDGSTRTVTEQTFVKPVSISYEQELHNFNDESRRLRNEVDEALAVVNSLPREEQQPAREIWLSKIQEREEHLDKFDQWQNLYQHRPFVDAYYDTAAKLPVKLRQEIQSLYLEIELLTKKTGSRNSEELFSPEDLEVVEQLEIQIKKLRQEARKDNVEYQKYLDQMNDFFEFIPNLDAYNQVKLAKEKEYANDPQMLEKWHARNTVYAPTRQWQEDLNKLYNRMGEILGSKDEKMGELFRDRSRIMAPYRRDGEFDPTHLTPEDSLALMQAEFALNSYKKNLQGKEIPLEEHQVEELKLLSSQIKSMTTRRENPYYKANMLEKSKLLLDKRNRLLQSQADTLKAEVNGDPVILQQARDAQMTATQNFMAYEQEFEAWYNLNHKKKYSRTFLKTGRDPRSGAEPREFNFDKIPPADLWEQYMEHRPRGKWNQRQIREKDEDGNPNAKVLNLDFEKHHRLPDGTVLPKSLRIDNGVVSVIPGTDTRYVNPKYLELKQQTTAFEFYNQMMPYYFQRQSAIVGAKPGYKVPGGQANLLQQSANMEDGIHGALKNRLRSFINEQFTSGTGERASQLDLATNFYGDAGNRVRLRFNEQLDASIQSADAINNLIKWTAESHYNEAMAQAQPVADSMIDYLELELKNIQSLITGSVPGYEKRAADLTQLIKLMRFERDKFIAGKTSGSDSKAVRKFLGQIFGITAFARIAFDMANQTKNYASGSLQAFMAANHGESAHYTRADMGWAIRQQAGMTGFFGDYLKDWGKLSGLSLNTQLYRKYNPAQHDYQKYLDDTTGDRSRRLKAKLADLTELAHAVQSKGDTAIAQMVWLAVMNHHEFRLLDAQGQPIQEGVTDSGDPIWKMVKAHEAYALNSENQLVIRQDVEFTERNERYLREIVHSEMRKAQGNYASSDKTQIESTIMGQIMNFFRKYLVSQVLTRMGHARPNWEGKELHYGYLRAMASALKYYGLGETAKHLILGAYTPTWIKGSKMNNFYSQKVAHAGRDLISAVVLSTIAMMLMGYVKQKQDDDEEIGFLMGNFIRVIWGVKQETVSMNPLPIVGGADDYIKNFTSFTTMTRELTSVPKILSHLLGAGYVNLVGGFGEEPEEDELLYGLAYQQAYYQRSEGAFEAGDFKLEKDFQDLTGWKNIRNFFTPQYAIDTQKKYQ